MITRISEENWLQFFLHIVLQCLTNHKNGKFTDILKCILWDFDKKSGYFLFLLSIYSLSGKKTGNLKGEKKNILLLNVSC